MVLKSLRRALLFRRQPVAHGTQEAPAIRKGGCYLILLSTLLRFIRQLLGALQYATKAEDDGMGWFRV